jgi:hypothetical protein
MIDYAAWDVVCEGFEVEVLSPVLRGRLLRLKAELVAGSSDEAQIIIRTDSSSGRLLSAEQLFFSERLDISPRWPVHLLPASFQEYAEYSEGYSVAEAPVLWGPLYVYLGVDQEATQWRFAAIIER